MKKIVLLAIVTSLFFSCATDDAIRTLPVLVFQGNLVLKTQAEVNAFGAQGYNVIDGALYIGDPFVETNTPVPSDITDLSPLNTITSVVRQLEIQSNPLLTSLNGLSNLSVVSGLIVNDNENLTSLDGLSGLHFIEGNSILTGQNVFIGGVISLLDNPSLTSVEGLSNINPQVLSRVSVNTTGLASLAGLENITNVATLQIINNDNLASLAALQGLSGIDTTVFIFNNDILTNYCILQAPLQNNPELTIYNVSENQFNPTLQNIIDGNCSQ
ncbi:receptor L domain protein [Kordia sp. SMS9]|uniref:hypothetical protein n=1 Tax=Kordia sp. SMS9 TaxID=2282170 RepID=UPI000E0E01AA|nr:hypothetical protein [Kordia sp. SMS9]AXG71287.1 receptor L domain protein [Kordia sp. SMS9]